MTALRPRERRSWRTSARDLFDRLPTAWLLSGITGVFLAVSAAFGGLDDAPVQSPPVLEAGDTHQGAELTVSVGQALLIDAFPEQLLTPEKGHRLLVVRAVVENTTTAPLRLASAPTGPARLSGITADTIRVSGVAGLVAATPPVGVLVIDDGSDDAVVQPGVPVELAFVWDVAADAVAEGDSIEVQLMDRVKISEGELTYGGLYDDPVVSATLELALGDVGAGVSE
jgi:hypothetical protein